ncbi:Glycoside hydrolase, family 19, catalytic [Dillenia turbinata]|uniref:Glycoside hydrolase, family 19, catalytic n=1 Tax=Dillenia turbinata TaxID=194707 RepID=A0AAN8V867_9MAGN
MEEGWRKIDVGAREEEMFVLEDHAVPGCWASAQDGPPAWGCCYLRRSTSHRVTVSSSKWPCVAGKKYHGRGPIQITNYNYGPAGHALGVDLLSNPDLLVTDPTISFKTAHWSWMTPQPPKPSCHDAITGIWTPSTADKAAGRLP